jgi:hypothetical protein
VGIEGEGGGRGGGRGCCGKEGGARGKGGAGVEGLPVWPPDLQVEPA